MKIISIFSQNKTFSRDFTSFYCRNFSYERLKYLTILKDFFLLQLEIKGHYFEFQKLYLDSIQIY